MDATPTIASNASGTDPKEPFLKHPSKKLVMIAHPPHTPCPRASPIRGMARNEKRTERRNKTPHGNPRGTNSKLVPAFLSAVTSGLKGRKPAKTKQVRHTPMLPRPTRDR